MSRTHTIGDMTTRSDRLRRFLSGGSVEVGLAAVLFVLDALTHRPDDPFWALPVAFITCAGAATTAWHPRIGAVAACLGLVGLALLPPTAVGTSFYAPLIVVLSCAWRDEVWTAVAASVWGYAVSLWNTLQRTATAVQGAQSVIVFLGLYALPWIVGLSLRRAQVAERQRLTAHTEAQRREIAAELHDNVTHDLALIIMQAEAARIDPQADLKEALAGIAARGRRTSAYLTNLMRLLRIGTPSLPISFSEELQTGEKSLSAAGYDLQIHTDGDVEAISTVVSDVLGRIAREAFNNIAKHGDPTESCETNVTIEESRIAVTFTNATKETYLGDGLGIIGMRERAQGIGGTLHTRLSDGYWSVDVSIPEIISGQNIS